MIYDDTNKLIYIHVPKTAGTSISTTLTSKIKKCHLPVRALLNDQFRESIKHNFNWGKVNMSRWDEHFKNLRERWEEYTTFTVVRNPWDRLVSDYHYNLNKGIEPRTFEQLVKDLYQHRGIWKETQFYWLCDDNNNIPVNKILKFESLQNDFKQIISTVSLPHKNSTNHLNSREYYTTETEEIVREFFIDDIITFNYQF